MCIATFPGPLHDSGDSGDKFPLSVSILFFSYGWFVG